MKMKYGIIKNKLKRYQKIMGLLKDLGPMEDFERMMELQEIVKAIGVKQILNVLKVYGHWTKPMNVSQIKWGEEIEGHFLKIGEDKHLALDKSNAIKEYQQMGFQLMPEYGSWMFEMIPTNPYNTRCNFNEIIENIRMKYAALQSKGRIALTIPIVPLLGLSAPVNNTITNSKYIDDDHISNHPRFATLTKHIRLRRGANVEIYVPLYKDVNTSKEEMAKSEPKEGSIHLDAMAFGMGLSCLQCTFSTLSLPHARYLYDQLNVLSPLYLALTAGSPFIKGKVSDWDVRWNIICGSVDDRSQQERNPDSPHFIPTSRYCESNYYISNNPLFRKEYNDFDCRLQLQDYQRITNIAKDQSMELDPQMLHHLAYIFKRDLLIVHRQFANMSEKETQIFEMLNGTNWNSVRLKIPIDQQIGWRVEFRTMEVLLTPDQNSAFSLMIHLITRVLHENLNLNFYLPMSLLKENFIRAHHRDAVRREKFFFRTNMFSKDNPIVQQLSLEEIFFGKGGFMGIFVLMENKICECVQMCPKVELLVSCIKKLLRDITSGKKLTLAQYMRQYVATHPHYHHDSILSPEVIDDLLFHLELISKGDIKNHNYYEIFPPALFTDAKSSNPCL